AWFARIQDLAIEPGENTAHIRYADFYKADHAFAVDDAEFSMADEAAAQAWCASIDSGLPEETLPTDDDVPISSFDYMAHGIFFLRTDRDRPISRPTDSRVPRAEKEVDSEDRRALKAAQDWIDVGGDPEDNDWDDDTDDDEARARERWLDAQEARQ